MIPPAREILTVSNPAGGAVELRVERASAVRGFCVREAVSTSCVEIFRLWLFASAVSNASDRVNGFFRIEQRLGVQELGRDQHGSRPGAYPTCRAVRPLISRLRLDGQHHRKLVGRNAADDLVQVQRHAAGEESVENSGVRAASAPASDVVVPHVAEGRDASLVESLDEAAPIRRRPDAVSWRGGSPLTSSAELRQRARRRRSVTGMGRSSTSSARSRTARSPARRISRRSRYSSARATVDHLPGDHVAKRLQVGEGPLRDERRSSGSVSATGRLSGRRSRTGRPAGERR